VQANRVTMAAVGLTDIPDKVYYTAVPRSMLAGFGDLIEPKASNRRSRLPRPGLRDGR